MTQSTTLVPSFSYVDAKAAMTVLADAVGCAVIQSFDDDSGRLMHGEMRCGAAIIMMGSVDAPAAKSSPGGCMIVAELDAHFERARAAGADIVHPPEDTEFGTRRYRRGDPEVHERSFGTHQPQHEAQKWS